MRYLLYLLILLSSAAHTQVYPIHLGDARVNIIKQSGQGKVLVHLHENETTALEAAKLYVDARGGTLITLQHGGQRNITFSLHGQRYEFDPNRIFTDVGIKKTLTQYGTYSFEAHQAVQAFAKKIIQLIPEGPVIAVHNNQTYSLRDYFKNQPLEKDVQDLFYLAKSNYRNFYFVTQPHDYQRLKAKNFNIALQSQQATDDGSLSYFLNARQYINIESAYGAVKEQLQMIEHA